MNKLIILPNSVKDEFKDCWTEERHMLDFPSPFRMLIVGKSGTGKTNLVKNIIINVKDRFQKIYLLHPDADSTEYDDLYAIKLKELPELNGFNAKYKNLLIFDDMELRNLLKSKKEKGMLNKLISYTSTHYNLSIIITTQDATSQLNASIKRLMNVFVIYQSYDDRILRYWSDSLGIEFKKFKYIFRKLLDVNNQYGSLCIDRTVDTPYPLRLNCFESIDIDRFI